MIELNIKARDFNPIALFFILGLNASVLRREGVLSVNSL